MCLKNITFIANKYNKYNIIDSYCIMHFDYLFLISYLICNLKFSLLIFDFPMMEHRNNLLILDQYIELFLKICKK